MSIAITLTPKKGGDTIELKNVSSWGFTADRPAAANGYLGMENHKLKPIEISRHSSLHVDGTVALDLDSIKLAAAQGEAAYFDGEIKISKPDDSTTPVLVIRFSGHITKIYLTADDSGIYENLEITTTKQEIADYVFLPSVANNAGGRA